MRYLADLPTIGYISMYPAARAGYIYIWVQLWVLNTIMTHLYFLLTAALALCKLSDTNMVSTARTVCCSFVHQVQS
jgi:hypothetical protein